MAYMFILKWPYKSKGRILIYRKIAHSKCHSMVARKKLT